jgi:signal transduction histidine kinase
MENAISYLEKRVSNKVKFTYNFDRVPVNVPLNVPLFQWVIENLVKNAVDAMSGIGELKVDIIQEPELVYIDITDNGKGIPKSKHKTVFQPGYTTKQRGWGLGLSLAKRIIEEYHGGKIFVKWSEPRMGTTFRIILEA